MHPYAGGNFKHPSIGVEHGELPGGAEVADDESAFVDSPEPFAFGQLRQLGDLDGGESEESARGLGFVEWFVVEDTGGGVSEQSLGESSRL